jgi:lipopolysaccharide biosynthesis glycosyltransferase
MMRSAIVSDRPPADPSASGGPNKQHRPDAAERVAVLMCTDGVYLQHSTVCLASLLANNPELFFDIVVVRRPGGDFDEAKLRRSLARFANNSLTVRVFAPPPDIPLRLNPRALYTLDSWNRLWVEEFFADDVDRVLYLDGDIVVVGSIAPMWRTDLEEKVIGAVDIPGAQAGVQRLGLSAEDGYFNAGVILINLKQWRRARVLNTIIKYINEHPEQMVYTLDQDALNACLYDQKKRLDPIWNTFWTLFQESEPIPMTRQEIERVRQRACIIHYNVHPKPWSYFCFHPRKAEYQKYLELTEWRDFVPGDRSFGNWLYKLVSRMLPTNLKGFVKRIFRRLWPAKDQLPYRYK